MELCSKSNLVDRYTSVLIIHLENINRSSHENFHNLIPFFHCNEIFNALSTTPKVLIISSLYFEESSYVALPLFSKILSTGILPKEVKSKDIAVHRTSKFLDTIASNLEILYILTNSNDNGRFFFGNGMHKST